MINVRELRLGNYIYFDGAIHEILGVQKLSIWTKWHNDADGEPKYFEDLESYDPIPLTPELLEVCGFKRDENSRVSKLIIKYEDENLPCSLQHWSGTDHISICRSGIYAIAPTCKYLHRLQNLFYELTDTGLQIDFNSYGVNSKT